jgi:hypothetical protein
MVVDSRAENEGNGWAGSGANPWHLDDDTESVLFLTNGSDTPAHIAFKMTANNVSYYLTSLQLSPHETRHIDLRKLRDAQIPDFKGNIIPANATDGAVNWLRLDNVPVTGRLMQIHRHQGMASNYDCSTCLCPGSYTPSYDYVSPANLSLAVQGAADMLLFAAFYSCNQGRYYYDETDASTWSSQYPGIATVNSGGTVTGQSGGTSTITAQYTGQVYTMNPIGFYCSASPAGGGGSGPANVVGGSITVNLGPPPSTRSSSFSLGDNLSFAGQVACGATVLGAQGCSNGWFWQLEVAGTVSDNASNWTVTQDLNSRTFTKTLTNLTQQTTTSSYGRDNPSSGVVQQTVGSTKLFWLDNPGPYFSTNILSIDDQAAFTSRICSTQTTTYCVCVDWNYHLIGSANLTGTAGIVDTTNSSASVTRTSYSCQQQR